MSKYYTLSGTNKETGNIETLFGSYDKTDCTFEKEEYKAEYKQLAITAEEVTEKPDVEIYGDDIDPNTGEIRTEINEDECEEEEEFTEEEEEALEDARNEGYNVEGELARLYLDLEYANSFMLMKTHNMSMPLKHPSYKAAKVAYRAYWGAVDSK